ncbi:MAG: ABC transporter permease [Butyrivibrio sp.]
MSIDEEKMNEIPDIPAEKFKFVQQDKEIHDQKFDTKPVGYFKDAFRRFRKNKSSVAGAVVIIILVLFAIVAPMVSRYDKTDRDAYYAYALPKNSLFENTAFWNGCKTMIVNQQTYDKYEAIPGAIREDKGEYENKNKIGKKSKQYKLVVDTYAKVGYVYKTISEAEYNAAVEYEKSSGAQIFYPLIDDDQVVATATQNDANMWYLTDIKGTAIRDNLGNLQDIYLRDENGEPVMSKSVNNGTQRYVRILYSEWYYYQHGYYAGFLFGADVNGYDILVRLAEGARLSLVLSVVVSAINLFLGVIIGTMEGYYGGAFDLIMERIKDFIWEIPTIVVFSLFQLHLADKVGPVPSLLFAFVFFGWIGMSSTVRAQMYRFKGQEYVMAARTLGAKDSRLMFRHILPNGIGYIITASVLSIPSVILSEANMSFLGIVNLQSDSMTSIGTMLNNGQTTLSTYPHCVFFPAVFIALLLISFNMFGNGLRDAFNPALRGSDE